MAAGAGLLHLDVPATRRASVAGDAAFRVGELVVWPVDPAVARLHVWITSRDGRVLEAFSFPLALPPEDGANWFPATIHSSSVNGAMASVDAASDRPGTARIDIWYLGEVTMDEELEVELALGDGRKDVAGLRINWGVRSDDDPAN